MEQFTFKDIHNVCLTPLSDMTIGKRIYKAGEICTCFDKLQIANFKELKDWTIAHGGYEDRARVLWEKDQGIIINFTQGVMTPAQFALMTGSRYKEPFNNTKEVKRFVVIDVGSQYLNMLEDDDWTITLPDRTRKYDLVVKDIFGNEIQTDIKDSTTSLTFTIPKTEDTNYFPLTVQYIDIIPETSVYEFGKPQKQTFYSLQGEVIFVEDDTGDKTKYLLEIPKLQITSELKISIGAKANPVVGTFSAMAFPVGDRVNKEVMNLIELPDSVAFL